MAPHRLLSLVKSTVHSFPLPSTSHDWWVLCLPPVVWAGESLPRLTDERTDGPTLILLSGFVDGARSRRLE